MRSRATLNKLKKLDKWLSWIKKDPIKDVMLVKNCIWLACGKGKVLEEEKVDLLEFVTYVNRDLEFNNWDINTKKHWQKIEKYVRRRNGFKQSPDDKEAEKIRQF